VIWRNLLNRHRRVEKWIRLQIYTALQEIERSTKRISNTTSNFNYTPVSDFLFLSLSLSGRNHSRPPIQSNDRRRILPTPSSKCGSNIQSRKDYLIHLFRLNFFSVSHILDLSTNSLLLFDPSQFSTPSPNASHLLMVDKSHTQRHSRPPFSGPTATAKYICHATRLVTFPLKDTDTESRCLTRCRHLNDDDDVEHLHA